MMRLKRIRAFAFYFLVVLSRHGNAFSYFLLLCLKLTALALYLGSNFSYAQWSTVKLLDISTLTS